MPKINVYLPDDLAEAVKETGVPVSAICQRALEQAVRRVTAIRETVLADVDLDAPTGALAHLTARTRTALKLAVEQARTVGAPHVGTEHVLGGVLAEGGNLALQVLRAMEIEPERVGHDLACRQTAVRDSTQDTTRDVVKNAGALQFSRYAAGALEMAVAEAASFGHNHLGCEHLLLGLVAEPDGIAGQVLRALGAECRLIRRAVAAVLAGYVHLRAQTQGNEAAAPSGPAPALAAAVRQELQPLTRRIERLEQRLGVTPED